MYKRVLLKLSGEALSGEQGILNGKIMESICGEIKQCVDMGVQVAIVIGAGNIWRGARQSGLNVDRVRGDQMGMLATVINSLAMQDYLIKSGVTATVMSAINISQMCEVYMQYKAIERLEKCEVVLVPCGVGYPFFSTDTGMALRAAELKCDIILAAKNVDGVYDKDPNKYTDAIKYSKLTYSQVLAKNLNAIDAAAAALGRDNKLKTLVFKLQQGNILKAVKGEDIGTIIEE